jgi:hypothetical protein
MLPLGDDVAPGARVKVVSEIWETYLRLVDG